jgi:hypothetical protein
MITVMDIEPLGRAKREQDPPRKKDRKAAVRYGRARMNRYRRAPRPGQWVPTLMETWAFNNGRFIGASAQDDEADLRLPPHERTGLVRLVALAALSLPGGVLIENLNDLDTTGQRPLARAVLGRLRQKNQDASQDPTLWYGQKWMKNSRTRVRHASAKDVDSWIEQAGPSAVQDELEMFMQAVNHDLTAMHFGDDPYFVYLGSGPVRDKDLAKEEYQRLTGTNSDADIARYLETYGYTNPAGTVGRWYHEQLKSLRDNRSM